jgi:putative flippase GtrA
VRSLWRHPFVRFLFVGALNTAFGWGCYAILILLGLPRPPALLLATAVGGLWNYQTTGRIVFAGAPARLLPRFIAVYVGVYLFNLALLELACRGLGTGSLVGQLLALPPTVVASYFALRAWVFGGARQ